MAGRRGFGEVERRSTGGGVSYRARYAMPDGTRYSRSFGTKMDAEAWLATERSLIDREEWSPPAARKMAAARREREAASSTVAAFAQRYLVERDLRPTTVRSYQTLLGSRILPYFGEMPLRDVTLSEIKRWRASLDPETESSNAAAYRLLRSILQAAEEEELIQSRATEDSWRRHVASEARSRACHVRRDRNHRRRDARQPEAAHRPRGLRGAPGRRAARAAPV